MKNRCYLGAVGHLSLVEGTNVVHLRCTYFVGRCKDEKLGG